MSAKMLISEMEKGSKDFAYRREVYPAEWDVNERTGSSVLVNRPSGKYRTRYVVEGRDYPNLSAALEGLKEEGLVEQEAQEYLDSLEVEEWGPERLSLEETLRWESEQRKKEKREVPTVNDEGKTTDEGDENIEGGLVAGEHPEGGRGTIR